MQSKTDFSFTARNNFRFAFELLERLEILIWAIRRWNYISSIVLLARLHKERLRMQTNELISCIVASVAA